VPSRSQPHRAPARAVGDILKIGAPLVEFEGGDRVDSGTVVGAIPAAPKEAKVQRPGAQREAVATPAIKAPPAVRALAERLGVRLSDVTASGPDGSVTRADVERAAAGPAAAGAIRRSAACAGNGQVERAHAEVVPATVTEMADVGDWSAGTDVTIRWVRAIAAACAAEPALNAWYFAREAGRRLHDHIDLGIAVDTPDGLIVPTLRDVGRRDAADLRRGLDALKRDVTARKVPLEELRGQTITLSNFGMFSIRRAGRDPPQCHHRRGRIRDQWFCGACRRCGRLPVSLTFDRRAVMGSGRRAFSP
jgi:pyruvate dehydrogenase E2 component (dihydrolipoamide acetyltransferase)